PLAAWAFLLAPNIRLPIQSAARGVFPFRFGGQTLSGPACVSDGIIPAYMNDWMIFPPRQIRFWTFRMAPIRAGLVAPPNVMIVQGHFACRWLENHRARHQRFRRRIWKIFRIGFSLRNRDIARRAHKFFKVLVGHFGLVDPEAVDGNLMNGLL